MPTQKVRTRYDETPTLSNTLEKLVENEKGEKKRKATEGLLWLLRGLQFTCKALQNALENASEELAEAFRKSYEGTLKAFHNFVVKGIFAVGSFSPSSPSTAVHLFYFISGRVESMPLSRGFLRKIEG
jgi:Glycolipid transfer protein (GLTP)